MKTIAFDNETFLISRKRPAPIVVCTSIASSATECEIKINSHELYEWFHNQLHATENNFVGHNVAYDFITAAATWPALLPYIFDAYAAGRVTDTGIRQQLFDIAFGRVFSGDKLKAYSLSSLHEQIFGTALPNKSSVLDDPENPRYNYGNLYKVPLDQWPEDSINYAKDDALYTWRIWSEQEKAAHLYRDDAFQTYTAFCLSLISMYGMKTDPVQVERFRADMQAKMKELEPELIEAGLLVWDKRKGGFIKKQDVAKKRIAQACADRGVEPFKTPTGAIAIDKAACYLSQDELMLKRAEYATAEKMINTYISFLSQGYTLPISTRFHLAATGRTTSSGPGKPLVGGNFQNMPRVSGSRECVIPRPGKIFLAGDFAGAELHALAQICKYKLGYSTLGDALLNGTDVHLLVASKALGIEYERAKELKAAGDPQVKKARQDAKPVNFGAAGGMGLTTFIKIRLKEGEYWSYEKAAALKNAWLEAFPEMNEYFEMCKVELGPSEVATVEFFYSKRLRKIKGFSTMCNGWFQALTADGAKRALNEVIRRCYVDVSSLLHGARAVNFVHDELILEIDDDPNMRSAIAAEFSACMAEEFNAVVPDYPTKVDAVLMRRWSKAAEPVFNSEGELIPWTETTKN